MDFYEELACAFGWNDADMPHDEVAATLADMYPNASDAAEMEGVCRKHHLAGRHGPPRLRGRCTRIENSGRRMYLPMTELKIMEWNINQRGRQQDGKGNDRDIPLWIVDQIEDDINIVVFTEFNSHARNITKFYSELSKKGFSYSTTNYSHGWSNDILIAVKTKESLVVEAVTCVKAYPDSPNTSFDIDWSSIPENLRVDIKINETRMSIWGVRIKDLKEDYKQRSIEMDMIMKWLKEVNGINILIGDFNNLRDDTTEKAWNLAVLDDRLGENYVRETPENHSWGVSQSDNGIDGYIKNDHIIYSVGTGIEKVSVEPYKWNYLDNCNYTLKELNYYGERKLNIPVGEPDHGILVAVVTVSN